jgi:chromosome segregation ATPase
MGGNKMSDTPETDAAWKEGNAIREWTCRKLERERDEAREKLRIASIEVNARQEIANILKERDEAREAIRALAEHGESEIQRITKERDEARERCDLEATENMLAVNKLCNERDEARADFEFRRKLYKVLEGANSHLMTVNEEAVKLAQSLKEERDEAREALMKIEEVFIDSDDTYEDWRKMGNIARAALEEINE